MAAYTQIAAGDFNTDGQVVWDVAGHPDGADDTAAINAATTAAAAVVCGAITGTSAAGLVAQGAANTITSISNTTGTGALTLGATTFAGVCNWSGGGDVTINGNISGLQSSTWGKDATSSVVTVGAVTINMSATNQVITMAGPTVTVSAGANIGPTTAPQNVFFTSVAGAVALNGTVGAPITIKTTYSNGTAFSGTGAVQVSADWVIFTNGARINQDFTKRSVFRDCTFISTDKCFISTNDELIFWRCLFYKGASGTPTGLQIYGGATVRLYDCGFGRQADGTVAALTKDIEISPGAGTAARVFGDSVYFSAATPISFGSAAYSNRFVQINNYGFCSRTGGTWPAMVQGVGFYQDDSGTVLRGITLPKSGETYELHQTPAAYLWAGKPLQRRFSIPVITGDKSVAVTVPVARYILTSTTPAVLSLDPEGAWITPVTHTPTMTLASLSGTGATTNAAPGTTLTYATGGFNAIVTDGVTPCHITTGSSGTIPGVYTIASHTDTTVVLTVSPGASKTGIAFYLPNWYTATQTSGAVGGTAAKGMLGVNLIDQSYTAGGQLVWAGATATVTHVDDSTSVYAISMQEWG